MKDERYEGRLRGLRADSIAHFDCGTFRLNTHGNKAKRNPDAPAVCI